MSKEAKPIVVVYFWASAVPQDQFSGWADNLCQSWPDYHVLPIPVHETMQQKPLELEVFYDKNFTVANYEELKNWITQRIQPSPPTENKP